MKIKYIIYTIWFLLYCTTPLFAQKDTQVTLVVSGQGKTTDEATQNALRSAIEQAYGAFVSSKTEILNEKLINDEIVSVANGNIQKFQKISEILLPDGNYAISLKATVSVAKLSSFAESKGISIEFKGGLFAMNMAMQELYKKNELIAWKNTQVIIEKLIPKCFDYQLKVSDPVLKGNDLYSIGLGITVLTNNNYNTIIGILHKYLISISLSETDAKNYKITKHPVFKIIINGDKIYLRNPFVALEVLSLPWVIAKKCASNFVVKNDINTYSLTEFKSKSFYDYAEVSPFSGLYHPPYVIQKKPEDFFDYGHNEGFFVLEFPQRLDLLNFRSPFYLSDTYLNDYTIDNNMKYRYELDYADVAKMKKFLFFSLGELRSLSEIRQIKEYKVELINNTSNW